VTYTRLSRADIEDRDYQCLYLPYMW